MWKAKKFRIRETPTLAACADSSTNTMKSRPFLFLQFLASYLHFCHFSGKYNMSHVTCHLPPVTTANSHRPSPADSPIINSRLAPYPKKPQNHTHPLYFFFFKETNLILWPLLKITNRRTWLLYEQVKICLHRCYEQLNVFSKITYFTAKRFQSISKQQNLNILIFSLIWPLGRLGL